MIQVPTEDLRIMLEAGYLYLAMKRYKEAREVFEGVAILAPNSEVPWVALGNVSFVEAKLPEAIKTYKKALEIIPESAFARAYLGESLFFNGQKKEATQMLEEASRMDPHGKSGDFARSVLELIRKGFQTPETSKEK